jgi:cell division septal protein FtsQ
MAKRKRLRKQPKLQRVQAAGTATIPKVVVPSAAKKRKRRNRQRFKLPTVLLKQIAFSARWMSLGLVVVCIFALVLIGRDDSFYLISMPVKGNVSIPASEIIANSGLSGSHIFAADPNQAASKIGDMPGVISATVTLEWPNHVTIKISEDSPVALWSQNGHNYWITIHGDLVPARVSSSGLLLIESEEEASGENIYIPDDVLEGALMLRDLRPNIDRLSYRMGNGLSYQDGRGWQVYFGSGQDMEQKLVVYEAIVEELLSKSITPAYISVRNGLKPYYSLNGS